MLYAFLISPMHTVWHSHLMIVMLKVVFNCHGIVHHEFIPEGAVNKDLPACHILLEVSCSEGGQTSACAA